MIHNRMQNIKKECTVENIDRHYKNINIYILSDSQLAIKAENYQISSKLIWDCHQSLVKLIEHNTSSIGMGAESQGN
jgi:hypothetical protein